jgi:glycosyltransferase involved in cell wall biosynthesis
MHVVQMINALRIGGAEKLIVTFAQAVQKKDVKLTVITLRQNVLEVQKQVESFGAEVVAFNHRKIQSPKRFLNLVQFLRCQKPDVIHAHLTMATILGAASGALSGVPVVTSLHNTAMSTSDKLLLSAVETFMLRYFVKQVVAVGWQTAEAHQARLGAKRIDVIPNAVAIPEPVHPDVRQKTRLTLTGNPDLPILLSVSRLESQKGLFDLIKSFALVHQQYPDARLVIAGSGSLEDQVKAKVAEAGLKNFVHLLGLRQDIPKLLAASDIFVSAAHWEGLPVASLEAMAAGLPLAVTAVGDLPRVVVPGTGLLVQPQDPEALAASIGRLLEDSTTRIEIGKAAREHAINNYGAGAWVDRLMGIYAKTNPKKSFVTKQVQV